MNLNKTARERIKARTHHLGGSVAGYIRFHMRGNKWGGDACGCSDDRCKDGFHHQPDEDCGCLPVLGDMYAESLKKIRKSEQWAKS